MLQDTPTDYAFTIRNGETLGHIVFSGSDQLIEQLINETSASTSIPVDEAFPLAADQIHQVSDYMGMVLQQLLGYIAFKYLKVDFDAAFELPPVILSPHIDTVQLPFFCIG